MQNSAISFRVCVNDDLTRIPGIINELKEQFTIEQESGLVLATIRYYDEETIRKITSEAERLLEQRNGTTIQIVMRK